MMSQTVYADYDYAGRYVSERTLCPGQTGLSSLIQSCLTRTGWMTENRALTDYDPYRYERERAFADYDLYRFE